MKIIKFAIPCTIMIVSSYLVGSRVSDMQIEKQHVEIIKQNTEIIKSLGGCAETSTVVSDLLLRVSHYIDKHEKGYEYFVCPECAEGKTSIAEKYFVEQDEFPTEEVPTTHKQVLQDLREIETSIDSITFGHLNQMKTLENKLLEYRNQAKVLSQMDFFGGIEDE